MLAGNADRDRAGDVLKAAYAEGRLTKDEYDHRSGRALSARTVEELQQLTSDVPNGPSAMPPTYQRPFPHGQLVPYQQQPLMPYPPPPRRQNSAAVASLVCGLAAPLLWGFAAVPAVVLGYKARGEIRRTGESGESAATAGLVLGWIWIMLSALVMLLIAF
ncbi:DUF1707 and DUF4190 domain-containing protein [Streptomyces albidus (ex Kaewkla and Franco 2022)]|uniref:DUF1707 and DUF4190 domain-containing protein n=1 Tax=Streptomyces albidus (ex Kaewkla and Franco 2022) TaxID=722709 RepID=UPI0015EF41F4|nr:DUF1707 and DUF4190 domain-containing protein [Streptomyces albidus (ex Kaewkla and Franco 2022)]